MARRKRRRGLGAVQVNSGALGERAREFYRSAVDNFQRIRRGKQRGCAAIEHYTDVVAEASAAEMLAESAGQRAISHPAAKLVSTATRAQRGAVALCRRGR